MYIISIMLFRRGGGDTVVPISHIPDILPPNIPYPKFSVSQMLQDVNVYVQCTIFCFNYC